MVGVKKGKSSARLKGEASYTGRVFKEMVRLFPKWGGRLLTGLGLRAKYLLWNTQYRGQSINIRNYRKESPTVYYAKKKKMRLIGSKVNKSMTSVRITSFPSNLFERGRTLRSGRFETGKYIITRKLANKVKSNLGSWTKDYEQKIIQDGINKL